MKTLLVMRHAKSSWAESSLSDHDRPLNTRGMRDAPRMGEHLVRMGLVPDLIVTSTAERARDTALTVQETCGSAAEVMEARALYHGGVASYVSVLRAVDGVHRQVLVVAHNPGAEDFVTAMTGEHVEMKTATIAHISLPIDSWEELGNAAPYELVDSWSPKDLVG